MHMHYAVSQTKVHMGRAMRESFVVCGWYPGDPISGASQVYVSKAYIDKISEGYTEEDFLRFKDNIGTGLLQGSIMFQNSRKITERIYEVIYDRGYTKDQIDVGINWAYFSETKGEFDLFNVLTVVSAFFMVILSGYLIIYNIFQISIAAEIRFYGLLKTIGTTKKQIKRLVRRQAFLLSLYGIPIGLLLGYIIGNLIVPTYLKGMSGLQSSNFQPRPNPYIFLFSAAFSLVTIMISCRKPSKLAGRVSPMEAAKYSETNTTKRKQKKSLHGARIYKMALSNLGRNKKKTIVTILSLSLSIIIMTEVSTFSKSFSVDQYLETMLTGDFTISSVKLTSYQADVPLVLPEDYYQTVMEQEGIESSSKMYTTNRTMNHYFSDEGAKRYKKYYEEGKIDLYEGYPYNEEAAIRIMNQDYPIGEDRFAYSEALLDKIKGWMGYLIRKSSKVAIIS